jgi:hypothetical protein
MSPNIQWSLGVSLFDSMYSRVGLSFTITAAKPLDWVLTSGYRHRTWKGKEKELLWSPATYEPYATRKKANVKQVSCMVFDVDDGTPFEYHRLFADYFYFAHTTASHTPELNKWRLVLPLKEPVPAKEWYRAWSLGQKLFKSRTGADIDGACKDPSRMYFVAPPLYMCRIITPKSYRNRLDLDWRSVPKKKPRTKIVSLTNRRARTIQSSEKKIKESLRSEPDSRQAAAVQLGASVSDDGIARGIKCPKCSRTQVWFCLDPTEKHTATCNHLNSCGWYGSVYDLLGSI